MRRRLLVALAVVGCAVIAYAIIPRTVVIVPRWRVLVVDSDGRPYPEVKVVESWVHYSVAAVPASETRRTDANGVAVFDQRSVVLRGIDETGGAARLVARVGINASFGKHAWMTISEPASNGMGVPVLRERASKRGDELVSTIKLLGTVEQNPATVAK